MLLLTTVILAVCATLSTFKAGGYSTRSVLSQNQAANQWAYYQAKSIKSYLYEIEKETLELEFKKDQIRGLKTFREENENKIDLYAQKIKKYEGEKAEISKEAKRLESLRDSAQRNSSIFGLALIFLQIAILLSSISALMKKKVVWVIGMCTGAIGVVYFANGFLLFF
jgi:hypothetical protein